MTTLIGKEEWPERGAKGPSVVALGGGHGLSATLRALRHITHRLTAVVTVADNGGSSGRLRKELDVLPPGDLRMALSALCDDSDWGLTWRDVLQYRFETDGVLNKHSLGNLLIVALWEQLGDTVAGLDLVAKLLGAHGRVLPMASVPMDIAGEVLKDGQWVPISGQCEVAAAGERVKGLHLVPDDPPVPPEVISAINVADWIVFGPGSWYTSVLPHLMVPSLRQALIACPARRALIVNLAPQTGETEGMNAGDHVRALHDLAPELSIDVVVADPSAVEDTDDLEAAARLCSARLLLRQVRTGDGAPRHDPLRLGAALRDAFEGFLADVGQVANMNKNERL